MAFLKIVLLVKAHMGTWSSEPEPEPPEPVHFARSRSWSRRTDLLGAGAGAGMLPRSRSRSRNASPEPEPEPECFPRAGAGAGFDQKCHGSASLHMTVFTFFFLQQQPYHNVTLCLIFRYSGPEARIPKHVLSCHRKWFASLFFVSAILPRILTTFCQFWRKLGIIFP